MGNEVARRSNLEIFRSFDLSNPKDLAVVFCESKLFLDTQGMSQAAVKVLMGREVGIPPVTAMMGIDIIKGKLRISANVLASMVKASPKYDYRVREWTEEECRIEFLQREGDGWDSLGFGTFTIAEAKKAGLDRGGSGWSKFPRAMLFARAMSNGVAAHCPDVSKTGARVYTEGDSFGANDASYEARTDFVDEETGEVTRVEPTEPEPPDDPPADLFDGPAPDMATKDQIGAIHAMRKGLFPTEQDFRLWLKSGWDVTSTKALTKEQASGVIDSLQGMSDAPAA